MDTASVAEQFSELSHPKCVHRGSKLQDLCLHLWGAFERHSTQASVYADSLIELLQDQGDLDVARLVIPQLRPGTVPPTNPLQKKVAAKLATLHCSPRWTSEDDNKGFGRDQLYYEIEKRIFQDAEMHRASVMVFNCGYLDPREKESIRLWLESCPSSSKTMSAVRNIALNMLY
jgi:hypothetical protein